MLKDVNEDHRFRQCSNLELRLFHLIGNKNPRMRTTLAIFQ